MFVQAKDFDVPPYNIPNLDAKPATFAAYVDKEEEDCLRVVLGNVLYDAFVAGLSTTPTIPIKWEKLRDGDSFTAANGKTYRWAGMKRAMVPYIYHKWLSDNFDTFTENGVVVSKTENSEVISPATRITKAYNAFSDLIGGEYCGNYGYWTGPYWFWDAQYCYNTLYEYLYAKRADFDTDVSGAGYPQFQQYLYSEFKNPGRINIHGI